MGPKVTAQARPNIGWCAGPVREENQDLMLMVARALWRHLQNLRDMKTRQLTLPRSLEPTYAHDSAADIARESRAHVYV